MLRLIVRLNLLALTLFSAATASTETAPLKRRDTLEAMFTCSTKQPISLCCKQTVQQDGLVNDCEQSMNVVLGQGDANSLTMTNVNACTVDQQNAGYMNVACCESQYQQRPENSTYFGSRCTHASLTNFVRRQAVLEPRQVPSDRLLDDPDAVGIARPPVAAKRRRKGVMQGIDISQVQSTHVSTRHVNAGSESSLNNGDFLVVRRGQGTEDAGIPNRDVPDRAVSTAVGSPVFGQRAEATDVSRHAFGLHNWPILSRFAIAAQRQRAIGLTKDISNSDEVASHNREATTHNNPTLEDGHVGTDTGAGRFVQDTADAGKSRSSANEENNKKLPLPEIPAKSNDCVPDDLGMCVRNPARVIIRRSRMARVRRNELE